MHGSEEDSGFAMFELPEDMTVTMIDDAETLEAAMAAAVSAVEAHDGEVVVATVVENRGGKRRSFKLFAPPSTREQGSAEMRGPK